MSSTASSPAALRKAAILIATLDSRGADALLAKMPSHIADRVRQMAVDLDDVYSDEQEEVIRDFLLTGGQASQIADGVELDPSLLDKITSADGYAERNPEPAAEAPRSQPFRFLRDATSEVLARHLERQHPQVIAVVAAHLPPPQAADVIKQLAPKLQADVLRRVAELDTADQEVLLDIERELESLLSDELRIARNRQTGLTNVLTILNAAGAGRGDLLASLSKHQHDLAAELRHEPGGSSPQRSNTFTRTTAAGHETHRRSATGIKRAAPSVQRESVHDESTPRAEQSRQDLLPAEFPEDGLPAHTVSFDELAALGDDDWAVLIRSVEPQVILLAFTGASDQLLKRITQRLSKSEAQELRNKLHQTGPLRLSDIEQAQRHVARLASQLAARGAIHLPERKGFAAAA